MERRRPEQRKGGKKKRKQDVRFLRAALALGSHVTPCSEPVRLFQRLATLSLGSELTKPVKRTENWPRARSCGDRPRVPSMDDARMLTRRAR